MVRNFLSVHIHNVGKKLEGIEGDAYGKNYFWYNFRYTENTLYVCEYKACVLEYTYKTKQERQAKRTAAATRRADNVFSGTESAACLKTYELYVGGQRFVPAKITYTDGSGNTVTATVLAAM